MDKSVSQQLIGNNRHTRESLSGADKSLFKASSYETDGKYIEAKAMLRATIQHCTDALNKIEEREIIIQRHGLPSDT